MITLKMSSVVRPDMNYNLIWGCPEFYFQFIELNDIVVDMNDAHIWFQQINVQIVTIS